MISPIEIRTPTVKPGTRRRPARGEGLAQEPQPPRRVAAPAVVPQVRARVEELRRQVAVRRDDLDPVEPGGLQPRRGCPEPGDDLLDQRLGHRPGHDVEPLGGDRGRRPRHRERAVLRVHDLAAAVEQLPERGRPMAVDRLGQTCEARDRAVVVRGQLGRGVAGRRVDARDLDHDQPRAAARPRLLVRDEAVRDPAVGGHDRVVARRHDPVPDRRAADRHRREQGGEGRRARGIHARSIAPSDHRARARRAVRIGSSGKAGSGAAPAIVGPWTDGRREPAPRSTRPGWDASPTAMRGTSRSGSRPTARRAPSATGCCSWSTTPS